MQMQTALRWTLVTACLLALVLVPFVLFEEDVQRVTDRVFASGATRPALGAFVAALLALDIVLPVPSSIAITLSGSALGWVMGALVSWVGLSAGCILGYWIGARGGTPLIRRLVGEDELARAQGLAASVGWRGLVLSRAVPVLAEISVIAAGSARLRPVLFLTAVLPANLGIALVYAAVGHLAFDKGSFLLAFAAAIALPAVVLLIHGRLRSG